METDMEVEDLSPGLSLVISDPRTCHYAEMEENTEMEEMAPPRPLGMCLPIAPPVVQPSRKVARKSTAKPSRNLSTPIVDPKEANNNDSMTMDLDLDAKAKEAARRLHEKLHARKSLAAPVTEVLKEKEFIQTSIRQFLPTTSVAAAAELETNGEEESPKYTQVPKHLQQSKYLQESKDPMLSNYPQVPKYPLESKDPKVPVYPEVSESLQAIKDLASPSSPEPGFKMGKTSLVHELFLKAFLYDGIDKCTSCNVTFGGNQALKKHLRNGHQVKMIRETETTDLEILNREQLDDFIKNTRPPVCRFCGTKYKYLSCMLKHEVVCQTKSGETSKSEPSLLEEQDEEIASRSPLEYMDNGLKMYQCQLCGLAVGDQQTFYHHFSKTHGERSQSQLTERSLVEREDSERSRSVDRNVAKRSRLGDKNGGRAKSLSVERLTDSSPECIIQTAASQPTGRLLGSLTFENVTPMQVEQPTRFSNIERLDVAQNIAAITPTKQEVDDIYDSSNIDIDNPANQEFDPVPPLSKGIIKVEVDGVRMFRCLICNFDLSLKSNLKRHYGRHTKYFYGCSYCGYRMETVGEFRQHKIHCTLRPPRSNTTDYKYSIVSTKVKRHSTMALKTVLPRVAPKSPVLPRAPRAPIRRQYEKTNLSPREGIRRLFIGGVLHWRCMVCPKKARYRSIIEKHYECHFSSSGNYLCRYCNHKSLDATEHRMHEADCLQSAPSDGAEILTPSKARQSNGSYKCHLCKRVFSQVYNYKRHAMKHSGTGAFKCEECGRRFKHFRARDKCDHGAPGHNSSQGFLGDNTNIQQADKSESAESSAVGGCDAAKKVASSATKLKGEPLPAGQGEQTVTQSPGSEPTAVSRLRRSSAASTSSLQATDTTTVLLTRLRSSSVASASVSPQAQDASRPRRSSAGSRASPQAKGLTVSPRLHRAAKQSGRLTKSERASLLAALSPERKGLRGRRPMKLSKTGLDLPDSNQGTDSASKDVLTKEGNHAGRKRKSPMDGLTHSQVMSWARRLLTQSTEQKTKHKRHLNIRNQKCQICHKTFTSKYGLRTHLMYHARGPPEDCPHCGRSFIYHSYRERHIAVCNERNGSEERVTKGDEKVSICEGGGTQANDTEGNAELEKEKDTEVENFPQQMSTGTANNKSTVKDNMKETNISDQEVPSAQEKNGTDSVHHEDINNDRECSNGETKDEEIHLNTKLHIPKKPVRLYVQTPFDKVYKKLYIDEVRFYECSTCKRLFKDHDTIVKHVKIHDAKAFLCKLCERSFPTWMQYRRHQISTHGVNPIEEYESDAEEEIVISDIESEDSDEEMYIDMEQDMEGEIGEDVDVKPLFRSLTLKSEINMEIGDQDNKDFQQGNEEFDNGKEVIVPQNDDGLNLKRTESAPRYGGRTIVQSQRKEEKANYEGEKGENLYEKRNKIGKEDTKVVIHHENEAEKPKRRGRFKKRKYQCDNCDKLLKTAGALFKHRLIHYKYNCQRCNIRFKSAEERQKHRCEKHGITEAGDVNMAGTSAVLAVTGCDNVPGTSKAAIKSQQEDGESQYDEQKDTKRKLEDSSASPVSQWKRTCTASPALTDSSNEDRKTTRYLCPGCHKLIKSDSQLYSHMNLCIPDQPGSSYSCFKCSDVFLFRAAHIIHEHCCKGTKQDNTEDDRSSVGSLQETPTKSALRNKCSSSPGAFNKMYPSEGAADNIPRSPEKKAPHSLPEREQNGLKIINCFECGKELKAWSIHKHVTLCCPDKNVMFHTCTRCGHSTKTYAGYMIHVQVGCDPAKKALRRGQEYTSRSGSLDTADRNEFQGQNQTPHTIGSHGLAHTHDHPESNDFPRHQMPHPPGSMEILNAPDGTPIKMEIQQVDNEYFEQNLSQNETATDLLNISPDSTDDAGKRYLCDICNKEYRSHSGLDYHRKKCVVKRAAASKEDGAGQGEHIVPRNRNRPVAGYRCQYCGDTFYHAALLQIHEASHSAKLQQESQDMENVEIISCNICGKEFTNKQRLVRHRKIHLNQKPFKCKLCMKGFSRRDNLRAHEYIVHHRMRPAFEGGAMALPDENSSFQKSNAEFQKNDSGFQNTDEYQGIVGFDNTAGLENAHVGLEGSGTGFQDTGAGLMDTAAGFATNAYHDSDAEFEDADAYQNAETGGYEYYESAGIGQEVRPIAAYRPQAESYAAFDTQIAEDQPLNLQAGQGDMQDQDGDADSDEAETEKQEEDCQEFTIKQQYQCTKCPVVCDSLPAIRTHMSTHKQKAQERSYQCKVCDLTFTVLGDLKQHLALHEESANKTYVCPYCDRVFNQKAALQSHIICHTGSLPFQCSFCPKGFSCDTDLKNHEKTHMVLYTCDICDEKFPRKEELKVHRLNHMKEAAMPHHSGTAKECL